MELDENMMMLFEFTDLDPAVGNVDITYFHSGDNGGYYDLMAGSFSQGQSKESTTCGEYISSPANASIPFAMFNNEYMESGILKVSMTFNDPASANTCVRREMTFVNLKYQLVDCSYPSSMPSSTPSNALSSMPPISSEPLSRFTALGNVVGSYYSPNRPFDFGQATNQYAALELLVKSDPGLVPVPFESNGEYLLLQRYVLVLLYLDTNGDMWHGDRWLEDEAGFITCNWSGVDCSLDGSINYLFRTYNTVKREPAICNMISSLTAVFFSKSRQQ
jgi:hypothetical protein